MRAFWHAALDNIVFIGSSMLPTISRQYNRQASESHVSRYDSLEIRSKHELLFSIIIIINNDQS